MPQLPKGLWFAPLIGWGLRRVNKERSHHCKRRIFAFAIAL
ncbi:MAG TPA: hypothetical protein V6D29_18470 [Leptolyngbyaceae cyanobacterium]